MSRTLQHTLFVVAAFAGALVATSADAAVVAHHGRTAARANPGPGPGSAVHHGGTTVARATPYRPATGPQVAHVSRTAGVRRW
jgi:hypothetical protein